MVVLGVVSGCPECDSGFCQVIRRHFNCHLITRHNPDEMLTHFPGNMRQNHVAVAEFHPKHCSGKNFHNDAIRRNRFFFCHKD